MKNWLLLSLMLLASSAFADVQVGGAGNTATGYTPFTLTDPTATSRHVAWVEDDSLADNLDGASRVDRAFIFGKIRDMLISQGIEVHTYTYSQIQNWPVTANPGNFGQTGVGASGGAAVWQNMGLNRNADNSGGGGYAVILMPYWSGWSAGQGHTGGKGILSKRYFFACSTSAHMIHFGAGSAQVHQFVDNDVAAKQFGACLSSWVQLTCFGTPTMPYGLRVNSALADSFMVGGGTGFRRAGALATGISQMVGYFRMPSQTDSVIAANDTLFGAWKVYCTNQGNAQTASPYTDYVAGGDGSQSVGNMQADILWAIISKWVATKPVKVAMSWNDYAEFGGNPQFAGRPGSWTTANSEGNVNWKWPTASYMDSIVADLRTTYGVAKIVVGSSGDSTRNLAGSFDVTPAVTNYNGNLKNWTGVRWGAHFHTGTDTTSNARNPFGRGASNFDTSGTLGTSRITGQVCRAVIRRSDSLYRTLGVNTSSFMLPGNDAFMPVGWNDYSNANLCPAESLFSAISGVGHNYVANFVAGSNDFSSSTTVSRLSTASTAVRWPIFADETYRTNGGQTIQFMGYDLISSSGGSGTKPDSIAALRFPSGVMPGINRISNELFGFYCPRYGAIQPIRFMGSNGASVARPSYGRIRVFGWHVTFASNVYGSDYYYVTLLLKRIKALEDIAGKKLIEWSWPEETYDTVIM